MANSEYMFLLLSIIVYYMTKIYMVSRLKMKCLFERWEALR